MSHTDEAQPRKIAIFDTSLRDGEQAPGFSMNTAQKLKLAHALRKLKVDVMEVGFAAASPGDAEAIHAIASEIGYLPDAPMLCSLSRAMEGDIVAAERALGPAKRSRLHLFFGTSDLHLAAKHRMEKPEALATIERAIRMAKGRFTEIEFSAEDALRTDPAFLKEALECAAAAGADVLNVPDTVGYTSPEEIYALFADLTANVARPGHVVFSTHNHNDLGMAVANSLAAVRGGAGQVDGVVLLLHQRRQVEHLEDPLEGDQRGHHVDAHVREALQRPEQAQQQRRQREQGADRQGPGDGELTAHAVDQGRRERGHREHGGAEDPGGQGDADTEVAHPAGLGREGLVLLVASAEQLQQQGATDVEALGHHVAEVGVAVHLLPGQAGQPRADPLRGHHEQGEQRQAQQRHPPAQRQHRDPDDQHGHGVGHRRGQGAGEGALGADDVVVEAADQGPGLRAGEERHRLTLDVPEDLGAQVVDQTLADPGRQPGEQDAHARGEDRQTGHGQRQPGDQRPVAVQDAVVDDALDQQGRGHHEAGVDHGEREEHRDGAAVGHGEAEHPAQGGSAHALVERAAVRAQVPPGGPGVHHPRHVSSCCCEPSRWGTGLEGPVPGLSPRRGRGSAAPGPRARDGAGPPAAWRPPRASAPWSRGPRPARPR